MLILLPIIIMVGIGVLMTQRLTPQYAASAALGTSSNPLVDQIEIRGLEQGFFESPADATARVMSERFQTDTFANSLGERAGLGEALDEGLIFVDDLRQAVDVYSIGESLVIVEARWGDPETSARLVDAMILEYQGVLESTVSSDAEDAVQFFEDRRAEAVATASAARDDLDDFIATLPPLTGEEELPVQLELQLERLNGRLVVAEAAIDESDLAIDDARLAVIRAQSEAGRSIEVIDEPSASGTPESAIRDMAIIMAGFLFIGGLIALTILGLTTLLDRSVRSAADIEAAGGGDTVAAVPVIASLQSSKGLRDQLKTNKGREKSLAPAQKPRAAVLSR